MTTNLATPTAPVARKRTKSPLNALLALAAGRGTTYAVLSMACLPMPGPNKATQVVARCRAPSGRVTLIACGLAACAAAFIAAGAGGLILALACCLGAVTTTPSNPRGPAS